ncbi:hypothetical protein SUDANB120_04019 [Streptomyces sp. enrichment culture]
MGLRRVWLATPPDVQAVDQRPVETVVAASEFEERVPGLTRSPSLPDGEVAEPYHGLVRVRLAEAADAGRRQDMGEAVRQGGGCCEVVHLPAEPAAEFLV